MTNQSKYNDLQQKICKLYEIVHELEELFPGRRFTLDGHLVGSIGEVLAAHRYGLELLPMSSEKHDAKATNGVKVQIKTTQKSSQKPGIALRSEPQHLIVLELDESGTAMEVFNGPGSIVWAHCGKIGKNGQRPISVSKLGELMHGREHERLPETRDD